MSLTCLFFVCFTSQPDLNEEMFTQFTEQLVSQSPQFTKSVKFAKMMLTVLTKYSSHVSFLIHIKHIDWTVIQIIFLIILHMYWSVFPGDCCTQTLPVRLPDVKWDLPEKVSPSCFEKNHTHMKFHLTLFVSINFKVIIYKFLSTSGKYFDLEMKHLNI